MRNYLIAFHAFLDCVGIKLFQKCSRSEVHHFSHKKVFLQVKILLLVKHVKWNQKSICISCFFIFLHKTVVQLCRPHSVEGSLLFCNRNLSQCFWLCGDHLRQRYDYSLGTLDDHGIGNFASFIWMRENYVVDFDTCVEEL